MPPQCWNSLQEWPCMLQASIPLLLDFPCCTGLKSGKSKTCPCQHNASSCTCLDLSYAFPHSMPGPVHLQLPGKGMPKQLRSVSCTAAARIPNSAARALESAVLRRPLPGRGEEFQRRCQDCCSKPSLLFEHVVKYMICDLLHVMNLLAHGTCFPT